MISPEPKRALCSRLREALGDETNSRLQLATVKLRAGLFTGSGVNLTTDGKTLVIATAAHNLWFYIDSLSGQARRTFWGGEARAWTPELFAEKKDAIIERFCADVRVEYESADMSAADGAVPTGSRALPRLPQPAELVPEPAPQQTRGVIDRILLRDFQYDACLLFVKYERSARPRCEMLASATQLAEVKALHISLGRDGALPREWELLQAGYGQTRAGAADTVGTLNFKVSTLTQGRPASYYDQRAGTNTDVMVLESTAAFTTLPGDSGGPLFAVNRVKKTAHVLGVTLGSDVFGTQRAEADALARDDHDGAHNNAVTSLSAIYAAWEDRAEVAAPLLAPDFEF